MALDHSLTYRTFSLKNIPHRLRLSKIFSELDKLDVTRNRNTAYLDVGCSNGYITQLIKDKYSFSKVVGFDHNVENLELAREKYPLIKFDFIDLNATETPSKELFQLVTCFETLEHVGDLENALSNLLNMTDPSGSILITVPIEVQFVGTVKFFTKTLLYGYKLNELRPGATWIKYFSALLRGNISKFRDARSGWGTHFGFDYRMIDAILTRKKVTFTVENYLTTRFYIVQKRKS